MIQYWPYFLFSQKGNMIEIEALRLNRFLAQCGLGSRRDCDRLIESGKILINGQTVTTLGTKVVPGRDVVQYNGKTIEVIREKQYIAYHKSRGVVVTARDPENRKTVYTALQEAGFDAIHLKYVGRLDRNSEGLLLMTNDGDLVHALTHPRYHIKKVYHVRVDSVLSNEEIETMTHHGVYSDNQHLLAGSVQVLEGVYASGYWYEIVLYEGKNRHIRRMIEGLEHTVLRLKRIRFAAIKLGTLKRGAFRRLSEREVAALKAMGFKQKQEKHQNKSVDRGAKNYRKR